MTVYTPGQNGDVELLHWYSRLVATGDLEKLLGPSSKPLSSFMRQFTGPEMTLWYKGDEQGWWAVAWCFPLFGGGSWGLWIREDHRKTGSREAMSFIMDTLAMSCAVFPVLVNTTKQQAIVAKTERLGYTYMGVIPKLFEGEDCHILHMTREQFEPIYAKWNEYYGSRQD